MRPQTPVPLTWEEHTELSRELRITRSRLHELAAMVQDVYGQQSRPGFAFQKVNEELDRLCEELEIQAAADLPGLKSGLYV